jgi:hypothetical protein
MNPAEWFPVPGAAPRATLDGALRRSQATAPLPNVKVKMHGAELSLFIPADFLLNFRNLSEEILISVIRKISLVLLPVAESKNKAAYDHSHTYKEYVTAHDYTYFLILR